MHVVSRFLCAGTVLGLAWFLWTTFARRVPPPQPRPAVPQIVTYPGIPGGTAVKILQFYAASGRISKGDPVSICYGVANARSVRIEPPVAPVEPALNRCIVASPARTTAFALFAEGPDGSQASASFTVEVAPAPPRLLFVTISARTLRRGEQFTLCYGAANASSVRLEPLGWQLPASGKVCRMWYPVRTSKYTLTAAAPDGRADRETFTIEVR